MVAGRSREEYCVYVYFVICASKSYALIGLYRVFVVSSAWASATTANTAEAPAAWTGSGMSRERVTCLRLTTNYLFLCEDGHGTGRLKRLKGSAREAD